MTKLKFNIETMRTITSPSDENITTYMMLVEFRNLPSDIPLDVNPRKPKMNTAVAKQLIHAVTTSEPTSFDINNRGIVITANQVTFNNSTKEVTIDFSDDKSRFGILDGGHTYTAIIQHRDQMEEHMKKFVRLEVLVGKDMNVTAVADARNTSVQVSDIALFELDDKFGFIKDAIQDEVYANEVSFKDNENKPIPIADLLKLMFTFNIKRYKDDSTAPTPAYSAKASVFKDFKKEYDSEDNIYLKLAKELPKFVELYEVIQKELPEKYNRFKNEDGKNASFGKVRGVTPSGKTEYHTDFTYTPIDYEISNGFLLPIYGAFRSLLQVNESGDVFWLFDPVDVWNDVGVRLVQNTFETDTNPQTVGKMKTLWQSNYRIVDSAMKDKMIAKLLNQQ